jgi:alpha-tubulin suppressor-like RCC1 family protein
MMKKIITIIILSIMSVNSFAEPIFNTKIPQPDYISNDWDGDGIINADDDDDDNDDILDINDSHPFGGKPGRSASSSGFIPDKINCGENFCYALVGGDVWSVGSNINGELGLGDNITRHEWTKTDMTGVSDIYAAYSTGFVLKDGVPWGSGWGAYGMLGTGNSQDSNIFVQSKINGVDSIKRSAYAAHVLKNGEIWSVGRNGYGGNFGIGTPSGDYLEWTKSTTISGVLDIATSSGHVIALTSSGVYGVGFNTSSQLGLNHKNNIATYEKSNLNGADYISNSVYASYAIINGEVFTTGSSSYYKGMGRIGNSSSTYQTTGQTGVDKAVGGRDTFAILREGKVFTYGYLPGYQNDSIYKEALLEGTVLDIESSSNGIYAITDKGVFFIGKNLSGLSGLGHSDEVSDWEKVVFN